MHRFQSIGATKRGVIYSKITGKTIRMVFAGKIDRRKPNYCDKGLFSCLRSSHDIAMYTISKNLKRAYKKKHYIQFMMQRLVCQF